MAKLLLKDKFTDAQHTLLVDHDMTKGGGWTVDIGATVSWRIRDNALVPVGTNPTVATADAGTGDVRATIKVLDPRIIGRVGLVVRLSDAADYWRAEFVPVYQQERNLLVLSQVVLGEALERAVAYYALEAGDVLELRAKGNLLTVSVNGELRLAHASGFNSGATRVGVSKSSTGSAPAFRFDDFRVTT